VLLHLITFLNPPQLLVVARVSRKMNEAASSDRLWRRFENKLSRWFLVGFFAWVRDTPPGPRDGKQQQDTAKERCRAQVLPRFDFVQGAPDLPVPLKIVAIGDGSTGKTSLLMRYSLNTFPTEVCKRIVVSLLFTWNDSTCRLCWTTMTAW
jgi:hypothetical protein